MGIDADGYVGSSMAQPVYEAFSSGVEGFRTHTMIPQMHPPDACLNGFYSTVGPLRAREPIGEKRKTWTRKRRHAERY